MKRIAVVTVGRSDYGSYRSILRAIQEDHDLELQLIVAGMHLSQAFGDTVRSIQREGFPITARVTLRLTSDAPAGIARSMGTGTVGFARAFARLHPDLLMVLGDRFEMHAAVVAAVPFAMPIAHIHGGEITEGAFDNVLRHSMTMLSHLHFVATEAARRRIIQTGEEPWRVTVSGAPGLDNLRSTPLLDPEGLAARYGLRVDVAPLLVTYHPVTLEYKQTAWQINELLAALASLERPMVFTLPNADTHGHVIRRAIKTFVARHPNAQLVEALGTQGYFSLMALAAAMVGNSSSGLIEAPSFALPVVNIGTRQAGRLRAANVIDVDYHRRDILNGIHQALRPEFRARLKGLPNPYGAGRAADIIVQSVKRLSGDHRLIRKRFVEGTPPMARRRRRLVATHAG